MCCVRTYLNPLMHVDLSLKLGILKFSLSFVINGIQAILYTGIVKSGHKKIAFRILQLLH